MGPEVSRVVVWDVALFVVVGGAVVASLVVVGEAVVGCEVGD